MQVHLETLKLNGKQGTVEITINNKDRREVPCFESGYDEAHRHLTIYGLAVRFSQGSKVWPGSAVYWFKSGNVNNLHASIDRRGTLSLVGYIEDFNGKRVLSQHNAVA